MKTISLATRTKELYCL